MYNKVTNTQIIYYNNFINNDMIVHFIGKNSTMLLNSLTVGYETYIYKSDNSNKFIT